MTSHTDLPAGASMTAPSGQKTGWGRNTICGTVIVLVALLKFLA
ncbi:hypothetical protein BN2497_3703 [Janthinobacterium sp. CG23_2]|nr:hypothetical protein BN2497_3703 [Janthinobacterium sp. CG23_2]CUU28249.1 hypothetical protein BN3177_3703 [Janthinobacterium sp. CG23_2]